MNRRSKEKLLMVSFFLLTIFLSISASKNIKILSEIPDGYQYEGKNDTKEQIRFKRDANMLEKAYPGEIVEGKIKFPKNYKDEIMIYKLKEKKPTKKEMLEIAKKFGIRNDLKYRENYKTWEINVKKGAINFGKFLKNKNLLKFKYWTGSKTSEQIKRKLKKKELIKAGIKFLKDKNLLPKDYKIYSFYWSSSSAGKTLKIRIREIKNGILIIGDSNYISLELYMDGDISDMWYNFKYWQPYMKYPIYTPEEARKIYKIKGIYKGPHYRTVIKDYNEKHPEDKRIRRDKDLYEIGIVKEIELVYYSGKNDYPYLIPMYLIKGEFEKSGTEFEYRLPAIREEYIEYDKTRDKYGHPIRKMPVPVKVDDIKKGDKK